MTDIWIDTDEVRSASNRFSAEAVPEASTARENVSTLCTGQAPAAKWGEQLGPLTFQAAYQGYLRNSVDRRNKRRSIDDTVAGRLLRGASRPEDARRLDDRRSHQHSPRPVEDDRGYSLQHHRRARFRR